MTSEATPSVNPEASSWNLRRLRSAITAASATVTPKTIARGTIENFPAFRDRSEVDWGNMAGWLREVRLPPPGVSRLSRRLQRALAAALRARLRLPPPLTGLVTANPRAQQPCSCLARVPGPGLVCRAAEPHHADAHQAERRAGRRSQQVRRRGGFGCVPTVRRNGGMSVYHETRGRVARPSTNSTELLIGLAPIG
jgi:hypothetical protein